MVERYYNVGKVVNTHGIKGEVRVISLTDFEEERFRPGSRLYLFREGKAEPVELTVKSCRRHKQFVLLSFEGCSSINEAEAFKGGMLKVKESDRNDALEEGEYYYDQIIGLPVRTEGGDLIGRVKGIFPTGANDVWVVERPGKPDLLLPYIEECVLDVDPAKGEIKVRLLEGLE